MKLTKAFVFIVLAAGSVIACGSALAQDSTTAPASASMTNGLPPAPQPMFHSRNMDRLAEVLNLTDAQKAQLRPILSAEHQQMRSLHEDTSLSTDERRSKMKEIREDTSAQLKSILTPEQFAKWKSMTHAHHTMSPAMPPVSTNTPAGSAP